jgi:hypothetical protein
MGIGMADALTLKRVDASSDEEAPSNHIQLFPGQTPGCVANSISEKNKQQNNYS